MSNERVRELIRFHQQLIKYHQQALARQEQLLQRLREGADCINSKK